MKRIVSGILLILLLTSMLTLAVNIQPVKASGTIYIRASGLVEGTDKIISADNITYTFTDNITDSIVVQRNNIVVDGAGYTVQGTGSGRGIDLTNRTSVTIKNMEIKAFDNGIYLDNSLDNKIHGNKITNNNYGIKFNWNCSRNIVSGNSIASNNQCGIWLYMYSDHNNIHKNNLTGNNYYGIKLDYYNLNNNVSRNNIANNQYGIYLASSSSGNSVYHNDFVDNTVKPQAQPNGATNVWDSGYPSGGNYWSDYTGEDANHDGIGDTPYTIDENNADRYPFVNPVLKHDIAIINVTSSKTVVVVGQNFTLNINVTVVNQGDCRETFNVTTYANITVIEVKQITLTSEDSFIVPYVWNTTLLGKDNYNISAIADTVLNETDIEDNSLSGRIVRVAMLGDTQEPFGFIDMKDIRFVAARFGADPTNPLWDSDADINNDQFIDMKDIRPVAKHFNETDP